MIYLAYYIGIGVGMFFLTYLLYILIMTLKPYKDKIPKPLIYPLYVIFSIGFALDVLWNILFASVLFFQKPDFRNANSDLWGIPLPTVTERLDDIVLGLTDIEAGSLRWEIARFICHRLLNPFDDNHCG